MSNISQNQNDLFSIHIRCMVTASEMTTQPTTRRQAWSFFLGHKAAVERSGGCTKVTFFKMTTRTTKAWVHYEMCGGNDAGVSW